MKEKNFMCFSSAHYFLFLPLRFVLYGHGIIIPPSHIYHKGNQTGGTSLHTQQNK